MNRRAILILKTGETLPSVKALHGDFEAWIAGGLGCEVDEVQVANVFHGETPPRASEIRSVVVTGSPAMVSERLDWSEAAGRWLRDLIRTDAVPILGVCYGHQLMAHALGGDVGKNPRGREMGTVEVTFAHADGMTRSDNSTPTPTPSSIGPLFEAGVFPAHMSHVESVLRLPPDARVLARTALDPHAVIEFGPRQWGVQFHPEFDRPIMQRYVEARREILRAEGLDPDAMIDGALDTPDLTRLLRRFARLSSM